MEIRVGSKVLVDLRSVGLQEPDAFESVPIEVVGLGKSGYLLVTGKGKEFKRGPLWISPRRVTGEADIDDSTEPAPTKAKGSKAS